MSILQAQEFSQTYPGDGTQGEEVKATSNGYEIISYSPEGNATVVIQTDQNGNKISSTTYFQNSADYAYQDGFFYGTGFVGDSLNYDLQYSKLDGDGNIVWEQTVPQALDNYGVKIIPTSDNGVLIAGVTQVTGDSIYQIQLTKADGKGNVVWQNLIPAENTFTDSGLDYIYLDGPGANGSTFVFKVPPIKLFKETPDGYVLNNSHGYDGGGILTYNDNIIKVDDFGNLQWSRSFLTASKNISRPVPSVDYGTYFTQDIEGYEDGSIIITYVTQIGNNFSRPSTIEKIDIAGNTIWSYNRGGFNGTGSVSYALATKPDGGAWWAILDNNDLGGGGGRYFYNAMVVYGFEGEASRDTTLYTGLSIAQLSSVNLYEYETYSNVNGFNYNTRFLPEYLPNDIISDGNESYVMTGSNQVAQATLDGTEEPFLLKEIVNDECPTFIEDHSYIGTFDGHNYYLSNERFSWQEAQNNAQNNGGHLVSINSKSEDEWLSNRLLNGALWMGLNDATTEGFFEWANGDPVDYLSIGLCNYNCVENSDTSDYLSFFYNDLWSFSNSTNQNYLMEVDCGQAHVAKADLELDSLLALPGIIQRGVSFDIDFKLNNLGDLAANNYSIKAYFSLDSEISSNDFLLGTINQSNTPSNSEQNISMTLTPPNNIPFGDYKIIVVADGDFIINEIDESNNFLRPQFSSVELVDFGPDLLVNNIQNFPSAAAQTEVVEFTFDLINQGSDPALGDYEIKFYLGNYYYDNDFVELELIEVGTIPTGNTPVGTIANIGAAITIPPNIPFGRYYLWAIVDDGNDIAEINEENNSYNESFNSAIQITGEFGADLTFNSISNVPATATQDSEFTFDFEIANTGQGDTENDFDIDFFISSDPILSPNDSYLANFDNIVLTAGATLALSSSAYISANLSPGTYYIIGVLDRYNFAIEETNENNNEFASTAIEITATDFPDLTVSNLVNLPNVAIQNDILSFNFDLNNEGLVTASGDYVIGMYLSNDTYFSTFSDIEVGTVPTGNTPVGTIAGVGGAILIPSDLPVGDYYLFIVADVNNDIVESQNFNNQLRSEFTINVQPNFEDDFLININCIDDITLTVPGNQNSGIVSWDENLISFSHNCNSDLTNVSVSQTSGLSNGSAFPVGTSTVSYTVSATCNGEVQTATCSFDVTIETSDLMLPDLSCSNIQNLPLQAEQGEIVTFTFDLNNFGNAVDPGDYDIIMYLSNDEVFSNDDIEAGVVPTGNTPIGTILGVGPAIQIPENLSAGNYYVIVVTDAGNDIEETNEGNNIIVSSTPIEVLVPLVNPVLSFNCNEDVVVQSENNSNSAQATWDFPNASTTCPDGNISISQIEGLPSGSFFNEGVHIITYEILDDCENVETCSFTVTVQASDNEPVFTILDISLCSGSLYNGVLYNQNTVLVDTFSTVQYDSIVTTNISIITTYQVFQNAQICEGESVIFEGNVYDMSGTYEHEYLSEEGCDSTVYLVLDVVDSYNTTLSQTSCDPNDVGTETINLVAQNGCDSIITITTTLSDSYQITLTETTCDENEAGTFTETFISQNGCDSIVTTTVNLNPTDSTFIFDTTCFPQAAGTDIINFTNQFGCDSVVIITTDLLESETINFDQTSCNPDDVGMETMTFTNQFGCDSIVTITTTLSDSYQINLFDETCNENEAGTFVETFISQEGCDSIVTTLVSLRPNDLTELNQITCDPMEAGTFMTTFTNQFGCDSIVTTIVSLGSSDQTEISQTTCDPQDVGIFTTTLTNQFGCDSVVVITVDLLESQTIEFSQTSCNMEDVGSETTTYTNQFGCDSVVTIITTFSESYDIMLFDTTCDENEVGVFTDTFVSSDGCDSTVTLTVSLAMASEFTIEESICEDETIEVNGTTYSASNPTGTEVIEGGNILGCDSIITINLEILPNSTETQILNVANGTIYNDIEITNDTTFVEIFESANGCDSTVYIAVFVSPVSNEDLLDANTILTIYPNPSNGNVQFSLENVNELPQQILLYNTLGQIVKVFATEDLQSNSSANYIGQINDIPRGTYILKVAKEKGFLIEKLIVQ